MTREEIAEAVMSVGGDHYACERLADAVRALPVMDSCRRCDDCIPTDENGGGVCTHVSIGWRDTRAVDAPPSWCPLRGKR